MTQLPLGLRLPPRFGLEDFLVSGSNCAAFDAVTRWPDWPDPVMVLVGPPGAGKTHLCHVWAARSKGRVIDALDGDLDLPSLASVPGVIDGADSLMVPEARLFHLLNLMRQAGTSLLIAARLPPDLWRLHTPDLLSRLRLAPLVGIGPPDEALVHAVLIKLFTDRQIRVETSLIDYLALRIDRSLEMARTMVEALDAAGLSRGRRITRTMASEVLASLRLDED